jgi:hypothetical protein
MPAAFRHGPWFVARNVAKMAATPTAALQFSQCWDSRTGCKPLCAIKRFEGRNVITSDAQSVEYSSTHSLVARTALLISILWSRKRDCVHIACSRVEPLRRMATLLCTWWHISLHWVAELIAPSKNGTCTLSLKGQSQKTVTFYAQHHDHPHPG